MTRKHLLMASLALNLLMGGAIAGHFIKEANRPHWREAMAQSMPESVQPQFRSMMEDLREKKKPMRDEIRASRDKMMEIMKAPEFDEAAYDAESKRIHELRSQMKQQMSIAMKEMMKTLSAEERTQMADAMQKHREKWRKKRGWHHNKNSAK